MPVPTVTCCICQKVVNKKQTKAVDAGKRACKSHEEAATQAAEFQETLQEKYSKGRRRFTLSREVAKYDLGPMCFCCDKRGMCSIEFLNLVFEIENDFIEQHGLGFDPLGEDLISVYKPAKDKNPLFYIRYNEKYNNILIRSSIRAAQLVGRFLACHTCCKQHHLDTFGGFFDIINESLERQEGLKLGDKEIRRLHDAIIMTISLASATVPPIPAKPKPSVME